jgi:hypothetical protein
VGKPASPLRYVPSVDLAGRPNVVVDGSPTAGTTLCLTHWPGIASPPEFAHDLSAGMAFTYLGAFDRHGAADVVTNNHFDQDGLVSVFALSQPEAALARHDLLLDVAAAGDFATYRHRTAARVSMVLAALADPARSPVPGLADIPDYDQLCGILYTEALTRLIEVCDQPDRFSTLWEEEDAGLSASEAALRTGEVTIEEVPDIDLAVVTVPETAPAGGGHRFAARWVDGLHPMALHNTTDCGALLTQRGAHSSFFYRYESWVQYRTRRVRPRVDLTELAARLSADEPGAVTWQADHPSDLTPTLAPAGGASDLAPAHVRALIEEHLRRAAPAWDPYAMAP